MSSDEESEETIESYLQKRDQTIVVWNNLLDDPFCSYYGFDHTSAIDILVAYEKQKVPEGRYTIEEYDAYHAIAEKLYDTSFIPLNFKVLVYTIVSLQEYFYSFVHHGDRKRIVVYQ
nr:hypothetical protein [Allomuricauda sp.]